MCVRSVKKGDPGYMHELNKELVMNCIYFNEPISRIEISRRTGISKSTVTNITKELLADGSLSVYGRDDAHEAGGRCPELLNINRDAKYFIGVNIGRTTIIAAITDIYGTVIDAVECPMLSVPEFSQVMEIVNQSISKVRGCLEECFASNARITSCHIGKSTPCVRLRSTEYIIY